MLLSKCQPWALVGLVLWASVARASVDVDDDKGPKSNVIILNGTNFDDLTASGAWFVNLFSPTCVHCRQLAPTWDDLANELLDKGTRVAKVDGSKDMLLARRFGLTHYPTLCLLRNGSVYEYDGERSLAALKEFALGKWRSVAPWPFYRAPNSVLGRLVGRIYSVPPLLVEAYVYLHEDLGLSMLAILGLGLGSGLAIGILCICMVDAYITRVPGIEDSALFHAHQE